MPEMFIGVDLTTTVKNPDLKQMSIYILKKIWKRIVV